MNKGYLILAATIIIAVAITSVVIVYLEEGFASQAQTDSTDNLLPASYIKADRSEGGMVAIPSVNYVLSDDKKSYVLSDVNRSVDGVLTVKTPNNNESKLRTIVHFDNDGSWLFIESISLTTQRHLDYIVLVDSAQSLTGYTVIKITNSGATYENQVANVTVDGSAWKLWGSGESGTYTVSGVDAYKGFIILVDENYTIPSGYNVVKIINNAAILEAGKPEGYSISGNWRVWNSGNIDVMYEVNGDDSLTKTESTVKGLMYDINSLGNNKQTGYPSDVMNVRTGVYDFTINVKYKASINVDPTPYQGDNMISNVVFLLYEYDPVPEYADAVFVPADSLVYTGSPIELIKTASTTPANGVLKFSNDGGRTYTITDISEITGTNAGDYTIYWKVETDGNYNSKTGTTVISIQKAQASVTITPGDNLVYSGSSLNLISSAVVTPGTDAIIKYRMSDSGDYTLDADQVTATEAGDHVVYWSITSTNGNYNSSTGQTTITIQEAQQN